MTRPVETDGALFDLLQHEFGVGDWDESSATPFWKWRATNVAKVKRVRESRKVTLVDLELAVRYCKAHSIDVRDSTWLYKHIMDAIRWERERAAATPAPESFEAQYEQAIQAAYAAGDGHWAGRLLRASGLTVRKEVLAEWQARR